MSEQIIPRKKYIKTKLVHGFGVNDANFKVYEMNNGKKSVIPSYIAWKAMIARCYSLNLHEKQPTYIGCSVCDEWLSFTKFKIWYDRNYIDGFSLDKDLLIQGNRQYSPDSCTYVPIALNSILTDRASSRGKFPIGVSYYPNNKKYLARCRYPICSGGDGKEKYLGYHNTPELAHNEYIKFKHMVLIKAAKYFFESGDISLKLYSALINKKIREV